jgi:protoporphyrinogen oxidase
MPRVLVLGCGWSGLVSAIRIKSLYPAVDVVCVDWDFGGGLLRSEVVGGYLFDVGGSHVVFSRRRSARATGSRRSFTTRGEAVL